MRTTSATNPVGARRAAPRNPRRSFLRKSARALTAIAVLLLFVASPTEPIAVEPGTQGAILATWNVTRLGQGQKKEYSALGEIVRRGSFDFLALQEAMTDEGVEAFRVSIEAATDERWASMSSHAIGRTSYKEMYAFLWNAEVIEYVDGAVVFRDVTDRFAREPYSARFRVRDSELTFIAATVHILHGDTVSDRTPEIEALAEYWSWLREVYAEDTDRILLMGDFNLAPHRPEWAALRTLAEPLVVSGATTLSSIDGRFANLYDNVWVPIGRDLPIVASGIFEFPAVLGLTHEDARRHVSDHAPVWLSLNPSTESAPAAVTVR